MIQIKDPCPTPRWLTVIRLTGMFQCWGPVTAAEVTAAVFSPAEDGTAKDGTAGLSKNVGRYGGSHETHFTKDGTVALETVPIRQTQHC